MEACDGGTDVMERSCAVARGIDINKTQYIISTVQCNVQWGTRRPVVLPYYRVRHST
jgi:hypothetical protein